MRRRAKEDVQMLPSPKTRFARRCAAVVAAACGLAIAAPDRLCAQSWPSKRVSVVVPFAPGSATDLLPRTIFEHVAAKVGQPIIIENRPGGGGAIGVGAVAKADPDGHTILVHSNALVTAPAIQSMPYDPVRDFSGITPLGNVPLVLVISPEKNIKTLEEFVAAAKAKPGSVNYASAGAGNSSHLNGERFRLAAGFEAVHLPFKGAPEALTEVIAGRADFYFSPLVNALPLLKDGQLQALAVSGSARASALPDVPTTVEAGYPNSEYNFWAGVFAPAKTPADIRAKLHAEIAKALQNPATREKLLGLGADPMPLNSAQFETLVRNEIETNTKLVKAAGIKVN
jgi:tripartite-type tricarboxylate transporter receptor subunit TctC